MIEIYGLSIELDLGIMRYIYKGKSYNGISNIVERLGQDGYPAPVAVQAIAAIQAKFRDRNPNII